MPSVAPHSDSLAFVLISKSTYGIFMLFIVFGMTCNNHFNSSVAKVLMDTFASKFQVEYCKIFKNNFLYGTPPVAASKNG